MKKLIKVCGMRDPSNIQDLKELKPDMIGVIFYPSSPRYASTPENLVKEIDNKREFKLVGVFVNENIEKILELDRILNFDFIQLHGNESPEYCREIRSQKLKVIKAFGISSSDDFNKTKLYSKSADMFLFDTKTKNHGGSGLKFDWKILDQYQGEISFLLSGGIGPGDHPEIKHHNFAGLDLNSRFELSPGMKDIKLLSNYFKDIRNEE